MFYACNLFYLFGEMSNILIFNGLFFLHHVFFFQFPSFLLFSPLSFKLGASRLGGGGGMENFDYLLIFKSGGSNGLMGSSPSALVLFVLCESLKSFYCTHCQDWKGDFGTIGWSYPLE